MGEWPNLMLKFRGSKSFGMKKLSRKNRVVQGDRVIEERVIEGEYCTAKTYNISFQIKPPVHHTIQIYIFICSR